MYLIDDQSYLAFTQLDIIKIKQLDIIKNIKKYKIFTSNSEATAHKKAEKKKF